MHLTIMHVSLPKDLFLLKQINLHDVVREHPGKDRGELLRSRDTVPKGFASVGEERVGLR